MKEKRYIRLLWVVLILCIILTIAHMIYVINAYQQCSIIQFIAKELW